MNKRRKNKQFEAGLIIAWFLLLFLFLNWKACAQFDFHKGETFQIGIHTDPGAMINDGGLFIGANGTFVMNGIYVGASISTFDGLPKPYYDLSFHVGPSFDIGQFPIRYYLGATLGATQRGDGPNPLIGVEGGLDWLIVDDFGIGIKLDYVYRSDSEFNPEDEYTFLGKLQDPDNYWRCNGTVRIFWSGDL